MSYQEYEQSRDSGNPIELYEFTQGLLRWYFTNAELTVVHSSVPYKPSPVKRGSVKQGQDVFKDNLKLEFPISDTFASQFIGYTPDVQTTLVVKRGHLTDPAAEFVVVWKGRVREALVNENSLSLDCESVFTSIKRPGLRARFEVTCRHCLYSQQCGLNQEAWKIEGEVLSLEGGVKITISGADGFPDGYFTGGIVKSPGNVSRFITNHQSEFITMPRPIPGLKGGDIVSIYPGCDHSFETCVARGNSDNFGGFLWVGGNPFNGKSIV